MITDESVESAMQYIYDNARRGGQVAGAVKEAEARIKATFAVAFLDAEGAIEQRKHTAEINPEVQRAKADYAERVAEHETIKLYMKAAEARIAIYQTQSANSRRGNI